MAHTDISKDTQNEVLDTAIDDAEARREKNIDTTLFLLAIIQIVSAAGFILTAWLATRG